MKVKPKVYHCEKCIRRDEARDILKQSLEGIGLLQKDLPKQQYRDLTYYCMENYRKRVYKNRCIKFFEERDK